jgi:phytoene dehydrogenase-like protein
VKELVGQPHAGSFFSEFPSDSEWDVVVIGGGPNGLITAAYLAKTGLKVCLVERRYEIGGGLATEEILFPGYYSNIHAIYHMMVDYMPALQDFDLKRHGLVWIKPNLQSAMTFDDGQSLLLTRMIEDTADSMLKFSGKDAQNFGRIMRLWRKVVAEIIAPATYIPPMQPLDISVAMQRTEVGQALLEITDQSPLELITENFEDDRIRALMLYTTCMWGIDPRETGVGLFVPLLLDRGMNKCYCQGGSHKLASSLAKEIIRAGGCILDSSQVNKITLQNGAVSGVELWEGRTLHAKTVISSLVISSLDPHTTFLDLIGTEHLSGELKDAVSGWDYDKWSFATLHVASEEAPHYACGEPWVDESFMTIAGFEGTDDILEHWDNVVAGKLDLERLGGHITCETNFDSHLSRMPGKHVSFFQIHAPYGIEGGWEKRGPEVEEALFARHRDPDAEHAPRLDQARRVPPDADRLLPAEPGLLEHGHPHRGPVRVRRLDLSGRLDSGRPRLHRRQQGGRGPGRQEVVEADTGDGEVHQDLSGVDQSGAEMDGMSARGRTARARGVLALLLSTLGLGAATPALAFSVYMARAEQTAEQNLLYAPRWSAESIDGIGLHDGIQVGVEPGFFAKLGVTDPDELVLAREALARAFEAWESPVLFFDIGFEAHDVGPGAAGYEIDVGAVHGPTGLDQWFGRASANFFASLPSDVIPDRLLTNGTRADGHVINWADLSFNIDNILWFQTLAPLTQEQRQAVIQRLIMHEVGHALGLDHVTIAPISYDTDLDPMTEVVFDWADPYADLIVSPNTDLDCIMSGLNYGASFESLFFTALRPDDQAGRDALYPLPLPEPSRRLLGLAGMLSVGCLAGAVTLAARVPARRDRDIPATHS